MKLSAPIHVLKREAKSFARREAIPLHAALDRIAAREGFARWSLLTAKATSPGLDAETVYAALAPGDLLLIGARPGHGKTMLGLGIAVEAMKAGRRAVFFTLEYADGEVSERLRRIGVDPARFGPLFEVDCSDAIGDRHIVGRLADAPRGTLAVIDYLQLLDQNRDKPALSAQVEALRVFARERGVTIVFISQIDRRYDPASKPCPDLRDVRLPNPVDLALFDKACFLHGNTMRFAAA